MFNKFKWPLIVAILFIGLVIAASCYAAATSVTLAWDQNQETDLAGYKLYQSSTATGTKVLTQTLGKVTTTVVSGLVDGDYFWVLTAFDVSGNESGYSNQVTFHGDTAPPATPKVLRVVSTVVVP